MKKALLIFLVFVSFEATAVDETDSTEISASSLDLEPYSTTDAYIPASAKPVRAYFEESELAIGTILVSHHFKKYDYHDYNETHNGLYISVNQWSLGTYINSADEESVFVTYNHNFYKDELFTVNLVAGVSNGYEGWEHAQGDYLAILGVSTQWKYLKAILSYDAVALGFELPLNQ